jgi:hypothetical protein
VIKPHPFYMGEGERVLERQAIQAAHKAAFSAPASFSAIPRISYERPPRDALLLSIAPVDRAGVAEIGRGGTESPGTESDQRPRLGTPRSGEFAERVRRLDFCSRPPPPKLHASCPRALQAGPDATADHPPLELCECAGSLEEHAPCVGRGVDCLLVQDERHARASNSFSVSSKLISERPRRSRGQTITTLNRAREASFNITSRPGRWSHPFAPNNPLSEWS